MMAESPSQNTAVGPQDLNQLLKSWGQPVGRYEQPQYSSWYLPVMYAMSQLNKWQIWVIGFDGQAIRRLHGYVDGTIQSSGKPVETNQSGRNLQAQALLQVRQEWELQWRKGYRPPGTPFPQKVSLQRGIPWSRGARVQYPVLIQPKLDGARCRIECGLDGKITFGTRSNNGNEFDLHHLDSALITLFSYLPPYAELDVEAYSTAHTHQELVGILTTRKTVHPLAHTINIYIFDLIAPTMMDKIYTERHAALTQAYLAFRADVKANEIESKNEVTVATRAQQIHLLNYFAASNPDQVDLALDKFVSLGFEGLVVRHSTGPLALYKGKKNAALYKYKPELDEEGWCIGVTSATGAHEGAAIFLMQDKHGIKFSAVPKYPLDQRRHWLQHPHEVVGKQWTFIFQKRSDTGVPIHPRVKAPRAEGVLEDDD